MVLTIVVDANPILSALLGGYARTILFDPRFCFITTEFTIDEVRGYFPLVAEKSGIPMDEIKEALTLLPFTVFKRTTYRAALPDAKRRIAHIDADDVDILALAIHVDVPLWSNDLHFIRVEPPMKFLRTRDFIL